MVGGLPHTHAPYDPRGEHAVDAVFGLAGDDGVDVGRVLSNAERGGGAHVVEAVDQ